MKQITRFIFAFSARAPRGAACVLALVCAASGAGVRLDLSDWPVKVGSEAQLFVDGYLVAEQSGVQFRVHPLEKYAGNPLIRPAAGEDYVLVYGSALREGTRWRMWYTNNQGLACAESPDGLAWKRAGPNPLTKGHRGRSDTATVFLNPDQSDPQRKYLGYVMEYRYPDKNGVRETLREGVYFRTSPDGLRWFERPGPVMYGVWRDKKNNLLDTGYELGDVHHICWDARLKKFAGHVKLADQATGERMRGLAESDDGVHWSEPRLLLRADERDGAGDQLYSLVAFPYESVWVGLLGIFHKTTSDRLDIQLAFSRDGRHWDRPHREVFLANGPEGAFDWGVVHVSNAPPVREGGRLRFYYGGSGTKHSVKVKGIRSSGIGLATLRPDGFVSASAGAQPGTLVTRPLLYRGGKLTLNAAIRPGGWIRVNDSVPVTGDGLALPVKWKDAERLPEASDGKYVRLRFAIRDADLYSFRIE